MSCNFLQKYSPNKIEDFNINDTELLKTNNSFLISGPVCSGKTSLLISYLNYYYDNKINIFSDPNILFMNNMKDQGIQFCRTNVKNFCQIASTIPDKKKIIAIDDIDEFSDVSQQVICNFIFKYRDNIACIVTCNNPIKVHNSLKCRTIYIELQRPSDDMLKTICEKIVVEENIKIEDQSLIRTIISSSNKSYKILFNTLQKLAIFDNIVTKKNIFELITAINVTVFDSFLNKITSDELNEAIDIIFNITESGISVIDILFEFFIYIKCQCSILNDSDKYKILKIISKYMTHFNILHEDAIELSFFTNDMIHILNTKS
jgi:DNA polymerase III delta prime subunit